MANGDDATKLLETAKAPRALSSAGQR